jgi:diaminohydroxyphosphoribosylaminopyrimidine deaminase/5-amino-6-(5-phosphoribosylamino)uracil reductase
LQTELAKTCAEVPVLVACSEEADSQHRDRLAAAGCEVLVCQGATPIERLRFLLGELGRRRMTNVLVEGGSQLLGSLFDADLIDECHVFVAPKLVGGAPAPSPIAGQGHDRIPQAASLDNLRIQIVQGDVYITGRVPRVS